MKVYDEVQLNKLLEPIKTMSIYTSIILATITVMGLGEIYDPRWQDVSLKMHLFN